MSDLSEMAERARTLYPAPAGAEYNLLRRSLDLANARNYALERENDRLDTQNRYIPTVAIVMFMVGVAVGLSLKTFIGG